VIIGYFRNAVKPFVRYYGFIGDFKRHQAGVTLLVFCGKAYDILLQAPFAFGWLSILTPSVPLSNLSTFQARLLFCLRGGELMRGGCAPLAAHSCAGASEYKHSRFGSKVRGIKETKYEHRTKLKTRCK
jgi:hypothetical protein